MIHRSEIQIGFAGCQNLRVSCDWCKKKTGELTGQQHNSQPYEVDSCPRYTTRLPKSRRLAAISRKQEYKDKTKSL